MFGDEIKAGQATLTKARRVWKLAMFNNCGCLLDTGICNCVAMFMAIHVLKVQEQN